MLESILVCLVFIITSTSIATQKKNWVRLHGQKVSSHLTLSVTHSWSYWSTQKLRSGLGSKTARTSVAYQIGQLCHYYVVIMGISVDIALSLSLSTYIGVEYRSVVSKAYERGVQPKALVIGVLFWFFHLGVGVQLFLVYLEN